MSTLQNLLNEADSYKEKISHTPPLAKEKLKSLDNYFRVGFTYSSNALAGNTLTVYETKILLEDGITVGGKPLKDYYETIGHGAAYHFMLDLARQPDLIISEKTIKNIHRLFYQKVHNEHAGQYRDIQTSIQGIDYIPPAPEDVPQLMSHLADQISSSKTTLHPIELSALVHKRLLDIHPFIGMNSRTARLLMNLILVHAGYGITCISPSLKNDYTNSLTISRQQQNIEPFVQFIANCVINSERDLCRFLKI